MNVITNSTTNHLQSFPHDMLLKQAMKNSAVASYEELENDTLFLVSNGPWLEYISESTGIKIRMPKTVAINKMVARVTRLPH